MTIFTLMILFMLFWSTLASSITLNFNGTDILNLVLDSDTITITIAKEQTDKSIVLYIAVSFVTLLVYCHYLFANCPLHSRCLDGKKKAENDKSEMREKKVAHATFTIHNDTYVLLKTSGTPTTSNEDHVNSEVSTEYREEVEYEEDHFGSSYL